MKHPLFLSLAHPAASQEFAPRPLETTPDIPRAIAGVLAQAHHKLYALTDPRLAHLNEAPDPSNIAELSLALRNIVFPSLNIQSQEIDQYLNEQSAIAFRILTEQIRKAFLARQRVLILEGAEEDSQGHLPYGKTAEDVLSYEAIDAHAVQISNWLFSEIPNIRNMLLHDVYAAHLGDPASADVLENILCYPGIGAIGSHRFAHALQNAGVPYIPRMMSEFAHSMTGIDIHPGAQIEPGLFIDHGTGVVIGQTAKIGHRVKIYQGVTLGALSFPTDESGALTHRGQNAKRHPTIEDDVVIYAGATILGGETTIGQGAVIGGNTWITSSVAPHTTVTLNAPDQRTRSHAQKNRPVSEAAI